MKIYHLNCGSMCPAASHIFPKFFPTEIVCHCLLVETNSKLILIDTGLGLKDIENPKRLGLMSHVLGVKRDKEFSAFEQIKKIGFSPSDVTDLIPTHLDLDHAGGIPDFKWANVHVFKEELSAAQSKATFRFRERYRPCHLESDTKWRVFDLEGEQWNGFDSVNELGGLPPELLLVRLPGHTPGHFGIALSTSEGWILHAGDSYYDHRELESKAQGSLGLRLFQGVAHTDYRSAMSTQQKLSGLRNEIKIFCSHDPAEMPS